MNQFKFYDDEYCLRPLTQSDFTINIMSKRKRNYQLLLAVVLIIDLVLLAGILYLFQVETQNILI